MPSWSCAERPRGCHDPRFGVGGAGGEVTRESDDEPFGLVGAGGRQDSCRPSWNRCGLRPVRSCCPGRLSERSMTCSCPDAVVPCQYLAPAICWRRPSTTTRSGPALPGPGARRPARPASPAVRRGRRPSRPTRGPPARRSRGAGGGPRHRDLRHKDPWHRDAVGVGGAPAARAAGTPGAARRPAAASAARRPRGARRTVAHRAPAQALTGRWPRRRSPGRAPRRQGPSLSP